MRLLFSLLLAASPAALAISCDSLASLAPPGAEIAIAKAVEAGAFAPPTGNAATFKDLPAFCRIAATLKPSSDSDIKIEVWMPAAGWNNKFLANGNGGWTGSINYTSLANSLRLGFATAMTDTGHEGGSGSFALDHPEKLTDFAYRAVHEMTVAAKTIIKAYYGEEAKLSYWNGCSQGGRQGITEAQLFPSDFDGIIAGAPANNWVHMMAQIVWVAQSVHNDESSYIPPAKYPAIHNAALKACDAMDKVRDGVIEDPTRCKFDPGILQCKGADAPDCLTGPQVDAARRIYSGAVNPRTKQLIYPGLEPGSELGWDQFLAGPQPTPFALDEWKYVVFKNPNWDYRTLNFDSDVEKADEMDNGLLNATDPNLKTFFERDGKLLQYHGWNDQLISPQNSVDYYKSVLKTIGPKAQDSYRLYMVPGMKHCQGGDGTGNFDMLSVIQQWVENGKTPAAVRASRLVDGKAVRTRPLCPYPQVAVYKGKGSTDDAQSFTCKGR
ncbi:MAG TPA: tannase/feruloyl esterase family alpha/beta hydrolase [Bryobacteraceae bacterium]